VFVRCKKICVIPFANLAEILGLQIVGITTRHHNIFEIGMALNILKHCFPSLAAWLLWFLGDCVSACANSV
jgi:hypothetical protein